ncbi:hypothetical protein DVK85_00645 [Flavobacterium arcticum]|uniref:Uncharacterized protein n=1 Tax=Flavobacterium arcticum TaxID=1784713 RepID=A0A345H8A8_9FLAO|nr:hypothetical protein [Flavobacterium arcticum]AXG72818.1 hypothetical protein DVK85_00645 [Flavobacterium arcticum]KAF2510517.1 hypothetical protein E0W72_08560 [Flavobacterium arcticum]
MNEVFAEIAKQENGEFEVIDTKYSGGRGTRVFVSYYSLVINYKGYCINVSYELGNHNLAKIEMQLQLGETIPEFLITNRSHYYRLFYRKANILKVESPNNAFKKNLESLLISTNLELLARENLFEPKIITSLNEDNIKVLVTEFHLVFENKKGVLYALITFYKGIVDQLG